MNHQKVYDSIIQKTKSENRIKLKKDNANYVYYEKHHILPKCLGGSNDEENLVLLTAREHYLCHKLLTYIYKRNRKIANAFCRMTWDKSGKHNISSKDYAYARELKSLIPVSEETRKKISIINLGRKHSLETVEKNRKSHKGKIHSEEQNKKHSEYMKGRKRSEEHQKKLNDSHRGKKRTLEQIERIKEGTKIGMQRYKIKEEQKLKYKALKVAYKS